MGSVDRVEDRTFKVNFTGDGAAKLREKVNDKLKEFMGDYTDDTLVEYVIVLLKNGRRMEEARNELNVFLGDDSDSFVEWLWDHLASNLDLYVQSQDSSSVIKTKSSHENQAGRNVSAHVEVESGKGETENLPRSRSKREWKGLMRDAIQPPPLLSSVVAMVDAEEKSHLKAIHGRSSSPDLSKQKKRNRQDERQHLKSHATINAPRRLLQFAVRDAVGTLRPSGSLKEPSMKRLRSVVSTSTADSSILDHPRRIQSIARVPNPMATVIKAVQEAAEDVIVKSARSVFDRLGRDTEMTDTADQIREIEDIAVENEQYEEFEHSPRRNEIMYFEGHEYAEDGENIGFTEGESGLAGDLVPDNEVYADDHVMDHRIVDVSGSNSSVGIRRQDSLMLHYNLPEGDAMQIPRYKDHNERVSAIKTSASISMNSSIWKPTHYEESREALEMFNWKSVQENEPDSRSDMRLMKENSNHVSVGNGNANPVVDVRKESLKTLQTLPGTITSGRPLEDADSRTIFVSNVHFAATKDSLSRHFNKFGDVLKVVIMTDAATGQPKGSAYVEFMRKEAADNALSLDGTSFLSRILKVVKRSAAQQEVTPMTWPRASRGSPYGTGRFSRAPFPRGSPAAFRGRLGPRSFQWKRDAAGSGAPVSVSPTARSLTYIRTEAKPGGSSGPT